MNDKMLELDLRILILRYGKKRVVDGLTELGEQTPDELERELRAASASRKVRAPKPSAIDLALAASREQPEIAEPLRTLAVGFQNRTFLPYLRDVERFLDRVGSAHGKLKSREAAASVLIRTLAGLKREELHRLAAENSSSAESDYSLLARAIMKPDEAKPRNVQEQGGGIPRG